MCVRDKGMKDIPREMAVDELHMGGKHLITCFCCEGPVIHLFFLKEHSALK